MTTVGDGELQVLKVLWDRGPSTVRDILPVLESQGHEWAYTTVLTMLDRLRDKGVVEAEKVGNANRFSPAMSREQVVHDELADLIDRYCDRGMAPLMLALVESSRFTPEEIEELRAMLDRLEQDSAEGNDE